MDGIANVSLYELHLRHDSEQKDIEIRRADDVFRALAGQQRLLQDESDGTQIAPCQVQDYVRGWPTAHHQHRATQHRFFRTASWITPLIHNWLDRRGFTLIETTGENEDVDNLLEVA